MKNRKFIRHSARVLSIVLAASLVMSGCGAKSGTGATEAATAATSSLWESTEGTTTSAEADADSSEILQKAMDSFTGSRSSKDGKDETVYVVADSTGAAQNVIVSEHLMNAKGAKTIQDESELKDIENVNGYEKFTQNGTKLTWDANGNDIYYRGTTDKKLPVDVKVSYKLDGKDISPEDLAGKDGKVTIRFDYTNNEKQTIKIGDEEQEVSVPFAMISGVILPDDHFSDVEVTNGRVLSEGKNNVIMGMAFPGLKESINVDKLKEDAVDDDAKKKIDDVDIPEYVEITANAKDFQLDMTMTTAMSDFLSNINLTSDLQDDTNDIKDQMGDLQDGSDKLVDGTKDLKKGTSDLKDGTTKLANGANDLKDGTGKLANGTDDLKNGTQELYDKTATALPQGAADLDNGAAQLDAGMAQLQSGVQSMQSQMQGDDVNSLVDGAAQVAGGVDQVKSSMGDLHEGLEKAADAAQNTIPDAIAKGIASNMKGTLDKSASDETRKGLTALSGSMQTLGTALSQSEDGKKALATIQALQKGDTCSVEDIKSALETVKGVLSLSTDESTKAIATGLGESITKLDVMSQVKGQISADSIKSGITASDSAYETQFVAGLNEMRDKTGDSSDLDKLADGAHQVSSGLSTLVGSVRSGADQLADGSNQLKDGTSKLKDGTSQLVSQSAELVDGITKLNNGATDLQKGAHDLDSGAGDLQKGTTDLDKGVSDLDSGAAELADGMLKLNDDGIEKLTELFGDNLSDAVDRINAVVDTGTDYKSFAGTADPDNTSVKFIYKTGEIKKK